MPTSPYTLTGSVTLYAQWMAAPTTNILVPSKGATQSGTSATLDASASNATSVEFLLFGGIYGFNAPVVCTATLTYYGWVCSWNTTTVPNGSYTLVSYASGPGGSTASSGIGVTVKNPAPTTNILVPSKGATQSGTSATLDASASNATSVEFLLFGGIYGFNAPVVCTATLTYYGWVCSWNTTTVPNGSYTLVSTPQVRAAARPVRGSVSRSRTDPLVVQPDPATDAPDAGKCPRSLPGWMRSWATLGRVRALYTAPAKYM